jgi:AraC-like DNA-binding protein
MLLPPPVFHFVPPSPPLRGWVRQHQLIRLRFAPGTPVPAKPYWPRPAAALAFYLRDPEWIGAGLEPATTRKARAALIGQPTQVTLRQGGCDFSVYQIEFEPGALYRLTGLPLDQLVDTWVDAEAVFPPPFSGLVDQLQALDDPLPQIAAAEAWLLHRIARVRQAARPADALAARLVVEGPARIDALAREHGLDTRQLRRQFAQRVGVSPKLLARIARFDHVIRLANAAPDAHWLNLALDAGLHDHQHLARDFRQFTLSTPSAFRAMEGRSPERGFGFKEALAAGRVTG